MNIAVVAAVASIAGSLVGFMAGYVRFNARVAVLESRLDKFEDLLTELGGKVDALVLRLAPAYTLK